MTVLILFIQGSAYAQLGIRGFVDTYHAMRVKEPQDFLSSRTRVRIEALGGDNNAGMFASFNAIKNHIIASQDGFKLREAYLQYASDSFDLRAGRQIIIWGKADGIEITDVISPKDYTEFLAQDYDDIRIPVDAFKIRYLRDQMTAELVWVPVFQPAILPRDDNPWAFGEDIPADLKISYKDPLIPENKLKNSEIGGRLLFYFPGFDLSFSSLYTWNKSPVMDQKRQDINGQENLIIQSQHHRMTFLGFGFSAPYKSLVFRGETAFFDGRRFEPEDPSDGLYEKNSLNWLLGVDYYPGSEWTITGQLADYVILDYDEHIADDQNEILVTFSVSKSLLRNKLSLSSSGYIGLNRGEFFSRSSADYELADGLHIETGFDLFVGDEGAFGQYEDNTEIWIKAKYSF
jgi:hypothetical protein